MQALSTPLASHCWHGRVPKPSRQRTAHAMVLPVVPANILCTWYVLHPFLSNVSYTRGKSQAQSASSRSTTRTARGARHSIRAFPADPTVMSSTAHHPTTAHVLGPRTFRFHFSCCNLLFNFHHSFAIDSDGSLAVNVGAHQAIAVHTGALGSRSSEPRTAERVPVLFNVNATTTFGEVGFLPPWVSTLLNDPLSCDRTFSSWATCRVSGTWIRPMRYEFPGVFRTSSGR